MVKTYSYDELDYHILQILNHNARASASEIARALNANERTIRKRIDRLVDQGAIRMAAIINPHVFGYVTTVDIFLDVEPQEEEAVIERLTNMPEISYIAFGQGTQDLSIEARFKDNDEMREFLRRTLPTIPGVIMKGYALVPRILRNIDEWLPRPEDFGAVQEE